MVKRFIMSLPERGHSTSILRALSAAYSADNLRLADKLSVEGYKVRWWRRWTVLYQGHVEHAVN